MTAFASHEVHKPSFHLDLLINSLNERKLETKFHLPFEYQTFESELKSRLQKTIERGTVEIYLHRKAAKNIQVKANKKAASNYISAFRTLKKDLGLKDDIRLKDLLQVPHIFQIEEDKSVSRDEKKLLYSLFEKALKSLEIERKREGSSIAKELLKLFADLEKELERVEAQSEKMQKLLLENYHKKLKKISGLVDFDPARISQEVSILLEKSDVHEEIVRLQEHFKNFRDLMKEGSGKKMDFYTQELLRETNTIGSKLHSPLVASSIVNMKALIERVRELVQNIE
jgi:uncharacterized protein (TIGR00255 family)